MKKTSEIRGKDIRKSFWVLLLFVVGSGKWQSQFFEPNEQTTRRCWKVGCIHFSDRTTSGAVVCSVSTAQYFFCEMAQQSTPNCDRSSAYCKKWAKWDPINIKADLEALIYILWFESESEGAFTTPGKSQFSKLVQTPHSNISRDTSPLSLDVISNFGVLLEASTASSSISFLYERSGLLSAPRN